MKILVTKEFEVCEKRVHTFHDSPVVGASEEHPGPKLSHGTRSTKDRASTMLQTLVGKYVLEGWKVSPESTQERAMLYDQTLSHDIIIWIEEKITGEESVS